MDTQEFEYFEEKAKTTWQIWPSIEETANGPKTVVG